jgi:hypothetical protein
MPTRTRWNVNPLVSIVKPVVLRVKAVVARPEMHLPLQAHKLRLKSTEGQVCKKVRHSTPTGISSWLLAQQATVLAKAVLLLVVIRSNKMRCCTESLHNSGRWEVRIK